MSFQSAQTSLGSQPHPVPGPTFFSPSKALGLRCLAIYLWGDGVWDERSTLSLDGFSLLNRVQRRSHNVVLEGPVLCSFSQRSQKGNSQIFLTSFKLVVWDLVGMACLVDGLTGVASKARIRLLSVRCAGFTAESVVSCGWRLYLTIFIYIYIYPFQHFQLLMDSAPRFRTKWHKREPLSWTWHGWIRLNSNSASGETSASKKLHPKRPGVAMSGVQRRKAASTTEEKKENEDDVQEAPRRITKIRIKDLPKRHIDLYS